jgi:perosamine synthetase
MIHQMAPWFGSEERAAIDAYLASGGWLTEFQKTREFANLIVEYVGSKYAFLFPNGTVTLFAALAALNIGAGDEVIVPDYTMIATANAVVLAGARPVFVDVEPSTLCIDLEKAEQAITPKTKAIMLVSLNGRAPNMSAAQELAQRRGIPIIEDAAQSLGSRWKGQHLGTFGLIGSFSFSAPKVITTGQGGALVTNDANLASVIGKLRDFGRKTPGIDYHQSIGYNFKFTDLQAVLGIEQMKKLEWRVQRKKEMFALYRDRLADMEAVRLLPTNLVDVSPWFIDILVPDPMELKAYLEKHGIGSRPFYPAIHAQPAYGLDGSFPQTEYAARHGLWLPSSSFLDDATIAKVCDVIRSFFAHRRQKVSGADC